MREIVKTIQLFKYNELSDAAKSDARFDASNWFGFINKDAALDTLKKLAEDFSGSVELYEIDWSNSTCYSTMKFNLPEKHEWSEEGIKENLDSLMYDMPGSFKIRGKCKLTGYRYDEDVINGFHIAWNEGERELPKLMEAAFRSLMKVCYKEYESFYNDEEGEFSEFAESNDLEFLENGELYR